eukprot:CAMPEP_0119536182 /NCGR_PEP_ID=MMETSP1344-20130328/49073_1 /TAXON_ID=236787 /ORGANISM="Florenciella parvula, Strain CCMP2471" /LENGTH=44 /DNA_ID= /DNA_START= /DNA_END= /DNA_ORIENTATION=
MPSSMCPHLIISTGPAGVWRHSTIQPAAEADNVDIDVVGSIGNH